MRPGPVPRPRRGRKPSRPRPDRRVHHYEVLPSFLLPRVPTAEAVVADVPPVAGESPVGAEVVCRRPAVVDGVRAAGVTELVAVIDGVLGSYRADAVVVVRVES